MYDTNVLEQITEVLEVIETKLTEFSTAVSDTTELYLELDEEDDYTCSYYFVDHALRAQFWWEEVSTDELGARNCVSDDHLRMKWYLFIQTVN